MPKFTMNFTIDISDEEAAAVADALACAPDQLEARLGIYAPAALREYVEMFGGQALTAGSDVRDRRLLAILLALNTARTGRPS